MFKLITSMPPFLALSIAIVFEVIATSFIPKAEQFTKLVPSTVVLVGYGVAFFLLSVTVKTMPVGIVYAIWSGAGIVLVATISFFIYGQRLDLPAIVGIGFIIVGVLIVNLLSKTVGH
ncbi:QacE family quaternary ammonium compound efflux SMR transporter [Photobacterium leiognathi subsp. mandapamensis]|uniref:DLP12 prophage multidrug resistance protein n=3 Tax=Photobacterium leiognathi TaxID=553611 RepID=V5EPZ3_PHOLE|nr:SMR family transporter [Photobacterium leiognathi]KJF90451.1 ethidium bromide resistance protein [Photobacterium leiognathi]KJF98391.1 ethidium bromide resistance protein [Photobacterium leiognathi]PSV85370.1 QacE family quaternary ammonium compound efflux SMR transporter [Photobacterium leiognathi]PSV92235.1 QacE family quaternary ammonium compound efflux SMR transporter [Photobacterium leiognathi]PSW54787.1 QacE family quaternary ammonium compound efflux SMR transporter [Photobacterium le